MKPSSSKVINNKLVYKHVCEFNIASCESFAVWGLDKWLILSVMGIGHIVCKLCTFDVKVHFGRVRTFVQVLITAWSDQIYGGSLKGIYIAQGAKQ